MDKNSSKAPKIRKRWSINPKTRVKDSKKIYKRQKRKKEIKEIAEEVKNGKNT
ncbi:MAG: hypothetical protein HQ572_04370 [Candidatus Omnitrophica bacterium]|nr:hypothetical protein [Candidatus Omnitrophota bacterium]